MAYVTTNSTSRETYPDNVTCSSLILATDEDKLYNAYYYSLLFLIDIVCLTGNSLIIYSVLTNSHMRSIGNIFILNLALSDLCQGITSPVYNIVHILEYVIGKWHDQQLEWFVGGYKVYEFWLKIVLWNTGLQINFKCVTSLL